MPLRAEQGRSSEHWLHCSGNSGRRYFRSSFRWSECKPRDRRVMRPVERLVRCGIIPLAFPNYRYVSVAGLSNVCGNE